MGIGNRIKNRRLELGLSVDNLADKLSKNRATIYRYEKGDIENLPITIVESLAEALQTTPAFLMGWEDDPIDYDEIDDEYIPDGFPGDMKEWLKFKRSVDADVVEENSIEYVADKIKNYVSLLNDEGKDEALKRVEELTQISKYRE